MKIHKQYYFIYVLLSRLQNLEDILFLKVISIKDINNQAYHNLQVGNE